MAKSLGSAFDMLGKNEELVLDGRFSEDSTS